MALRIHPSSLKLLIVTSKSSTHPAAVSLTPRRHGSVFTWRRHPAFASRFLEHSPRKPPANQRPVKEYLVSPLLLDLDAERCPAVRPFDQAVDDPKQAAAWDCQAPTRLRWKQMMRESQREAQWAAGRTGLVLDGADPGLRHWGVNEVDLVVFAMRGLEDDGAPEESERGTAEKTRHGDGIDTRFEETDDDVLRGGTPQLPTTRPQTRLGQMLHDNGVPQGLENDADVLKFLVCVHKQSSPAKDTFAGIQWPREPGRASMLEVRRLAALLAQSHSQDEAFHAAFPLALSEAASCLAVMVETDSKSQLSAVLQVVCGLQARWGAAIPTGVRIDLASVGIKAAASTLDARAMAFQLALAQEAGLWGNEQNDGAGEALVLLGDILKRIATAVAGVDGTRGGSTTFPLVHRRDLLHVLTGVGEGEGEQDGGIFFRNLIHGSLADSRSQSSQTRPAATTDFDAYKAYISALASLGAFRTILHEWHQCRANDDVILAEVLIRVVVQSHRMARINDVNEDITLEQAVELDVFEPVHRQKDGKSLLQYLASQRWS